MLRQSGPYTTDVMLQQAAEQAKHEKYCREIAGRTPLERLVCKLFPSFTLFFDGTNNNYRLSPGNKSNIARLHMAFDTTLPNYEGAFFRYIPGVGTPYKPLDNPELGEDLGGKLGSGFGLGGDMRIRDALLFVSKTLQQRYYGAELHAVRMIDINVFGFSRGATLARAFVQRLLAEHCRTLEDGKTVWKGPLGPPYMPLRINFMGLFDTVASVGGVGQHWGYAKELRIPPQVQRCVHLVAAHEVRQAFPLDSIAWNDQYPANSVEVVLPGVHSDIGGGYFPEEQGRSEAFSRIPLREMYYEAVKVGVPLHPISYLREDAKLKPEFTIADTNLIDHYHHYLQQLPTATADITATIQAHRPLFFRWRAALQQPGQLLRLLGTLKSKVDCQACLAAPAADERPAQDDKQWQASGSEAPQQQANELMREHKRLLKEVEFLRHPFERVRDDIRPRQRTPYEELILQAWDSPLLLQNEIAAFFESWVHDSVAAFHSWPCALTDPREVFLHRQKIIARHEPQPDIPQSSIAALHKPAGGLPDTSRT